jgi:hypothetical protein
VALVQVFSDKFGFPCQSLFHQFLHNHHHLSSGPGNQRSTAQRGGPCLNPGVVMWDFVMDKKWPWGRFSPLTSVSPANLHSICFSTIIFTITRGWHNRPVVAAVPKVQPQKFNFFLFAAKLSRSFEQLFVFSEKAT